MGAELEPTFLGAAFSGTLTKMTTFFRAAGAMSALVVVVATAVQPARADSMTAAQILSSFNLVTTGKVSTRSDIVGDAVIGGDLNGATFFGGGANIPSSPDLYLFGKLNGSLNLNSGGNLYYAGSTSGKVNYNGGGKDLGAPPNPISDYTDPLTDLSTQLADLTATAERRSSTAISTPDRTRASWCSRSPGPRSRAISGTTTSASPARA